MPAEQITTYKLMILYLLKQVKFPLTRSQLSDFMLGKDYCGYYVFQQAIDELLESHLVKDNPMRNYVHFELTREGEEALEYFGNTIPEVIRNEMDGFLDENRNRLRSEVGIIATYCEGEAGDYMVSCELREGRNILIKLELSVPSVEQAEMMCDRWREANQDVYKAIMHEMLSD